MSAWPATLFAAAERIARERHDAASMPFDRLARVAARLGLDDDARRLAEERERAQPVNPAGLARVYAALGDRAAIDRLRALTPLDARNDPAGVQAYTLAAAYQDLGDDAEADRLVSAIADVDARTSALAVLTHAAVEAGRKERAASLARKIAAAPLSTGGGMSVVGALAAGSGDAATAVATAPIAEAAALTLGEESRDEALTRVARLWLMADRPDEALRVARPIARRARRDFNSPWYAELARVLVDAGDASAGEQLFERHVRWYELERSAEGYARAALAMSKWGRTADAESLTRQAEDKLAADDEGSVADVARRTLVDGYVARGDVAAAIKAAVDVPAPDERMRELLAIATLGRERGIHDTAEINAALRETDLLRS